MARCDPAAAFVRAPPPGRRDAAPDAGFSPVLEAVEIFIHLLEAGMRTILFGKVV